MGDTPNSTQLGLCLELAIDARNEEPVTSTNAIGHIAAIRQGPRLDLVQSLRQPSALECRALATTEGGRDFGRW